MCQNCKKTSEKNVLKYMISRPNILMTHIIECILAFYMDVLTVLLEGAAGRAEVVEELLAELPDGGGLEK